MADYKDILRDYKNIRRTGMQPKEVIRRLRKAIQPLPQGDKEALAAAIKIFEGGPLKQRSPEPPGTITAQPESVDASQSDERPRVRSLIDSTKGLQRTFCWQCGRPNHSQEVICVYCGTVLRNEVADGATRKLEAVDHQPENFTQATTLLLHLRDVNDEIQLRPQASDHEIILGRVDTEEVIDPDVDLTRYDAVKLGVSRMHLSLRYDPEAEIIRVVDMRSANGTFINGQRLVEGEERVLRDGDQMRLGQLVIHVFFRYDV